MAGRKKKGGNKGGGGGALPPSPPKYKKCKLEQKEEKEEELVTGIKIKSDGEQPGTSSGCRVKPKRKLNGAKKKKEGVVEVNVQKEEEEGVHDYQHILAKVPPEVWDVIFGFLDTPQEMHNVMNSYTKWHRILASKRTRILFPVVIPHLIKYLPPSAVLSLRQVCKMWRKSIDVPLQNYIATPSKFECHWWHYDSPFEPILKLFETSYVFDSSQKILNFTEQMISANNPFISRTVTLKLQSRLQFQPSHDSGTIFLQTFGSQIHDFTHLCSELESNEDLCVNLLPSLLAHVPNIKSLKIDWNTSDDDTVHISPNIVRFLAAPSRFPPLPKLTALNFDFRGGGELEAILGMTILHNYGAQLETLHIRGEFFENFSISPDFIRRHIPNLKNLRLFCVTNGSVRKLIQLRDFPLKRLQLWYSFQSIQFKNIVKAINSFSSTLEMLHVDVKMNYPYQGWGSVLGGGDGGDGAEEDDDDSNEEDPELPPGIPGYGETPDMEFHRKFENLKKFGAPASNLNSPWFWHLVKAKFKNLEKIEFQTAMEALFAPFEKKYLKKEIRESRRLFESLKKLEEIKFWFHNNEEDCLVIRR